MALTKKNYELKELGITLDTAYAIIHRLEINGAIGTAEFYVQNSPRENALTLKPFKREIVRFEVNRAENPFTTAYNTAKGTRKEPHYNEKTREIEEIDVPNVFSGWEDDII